APLALEPEDAWRVLEIVDDYTLGCAVRTATLGETAVEERFPAVDAGEHPELARLGYPTVMEAPDSFEVGLETVLDGVERRFRLSASSA
ncbi:MAG: TetR/AcrR family transcriptional regulator C-terminal domain-containing protein, partial [Solirubrobacteraceae bacterium]